jgi:hypothetical protein
MLAVGPSSKDRWGQKSLYDKKQELTDNFYIVNKRDLRSMDELIAYIASKS